MEQKNYPDVSHIFAAKEERRRQLAALSWEEKVAIIEKMRQAMPRGMWHDSATEETDAQKQKRYRTLIKQIIEHYAEQRAHKNTEELICVFDAHNDNYLLVALATDQIGRSHTVLLHIRIKDNHVLIELDHTEQGIAASLVASGIPEAAIKTG